MLVRTGTSEYKLQGCPAGFCARKFALLTALILRTVQADTPTQAQQVYSSATFAGGLGTLQVSRIGRGREFCRSRGFGHLSRRLRRDQDRRPRIGPRPGCGRKGCRALWRISICRLGSGRHPNHHCPHYSRQADRRDWMNSLWATRDSEGGKERKR